MNYLKFTNCFIFIISLSYTSTAQTKGDFNWIFGVESGFIDNTEGTNDGVLLNFDTTVITFEYFEKPISHYLTNASISDDDGNLLFYTNGCAVANAQHEIMENGEGINPGSVHEDQCNLVGRGYSVTQSAIVLPYPDQDSVYAILHQRIVRVLDVPNNNFLIDGLYTTIVDMTMNNGLGAVIEKNEPIYIDTLDAGLLTSVKHSNGEDWWMLLSDHFSNRIYKILFSEDGFELTGFQDIDAAVLTPQGNSAGQAIFSPDGTKYARYSAADELRLYNFDRTTGELSNFQFIEVPPDTIGNPPLGIGGVAFSSSGRFLYLTNWDTVFQLDMEAEDIQSSLQVVAKWDGYFVLDLPYLPANFWLMQLAPDCRIYITMANNTNILHVIHEPDKAGAACNVQQHIELPAWNAGTMPNFPNYRLDVAPICNPDIELLVDTTTSVVVPPTHPDDKLWVYPNPATDHLKLAIRLSDATQATWYLTDALGQVILEKNMNTSRGNLFEEQINISHLPNGVYFWNIVADGVIRKSDKLMVVK